MHEKNYITVTALAVIIILSIVGGVNFFNGRAENGAAQKTEYLRIHIRANSNSAEDQSVKYRVRDEVVKYLTPILSDCQTADDAAKKISGRAEEIEYVAKKTLTEGGFYYNAKAAVRKEEFPTRIYGDIVLESGVYNAVIVELGEAAGDNWWCIAFPPLCFIPAEDDGSGLFKYRSKILEIIERFYKKMKN
ncbi:MAG: stage II sporulation protein R [Clostridiales bacterium]|jgi:stage II sporulation protein R|nr:stage II sporulation protein R [Clostridiales bacterium]